MDKIKITFTGDVLCESEVIQAHKTENGKFDFAAKFAGCEKYFKQSDYVIANLETPIANAEYSCKLYEFNAPLEFAQALKNSGVSLVTTANNHCLDRGVKGLDDTLANLDRIALKHIGTNAANKLPTGIVEDIGNMKIGFMAYTYGTNAFHNHYYLENNELWKVNLYQAQELHNSYYRKWYTSERYSSFRWKINKISNRIMHRDIFCQVYERNEQRFGFYRRLKKDIAALKASGAEYIIMCLHAGGQYNSKPLTKTKKIINKIFSYGANAVICNHEHVVHCYEKARNSKVRVFSLGNFASIAGIESEPYDKMAEYSVVFNVYLSKNDKNDVINLSCTFSIVKNIKLDNGQIKTVLLYDLINACQNNEERFVLMADNAKICNLFTNKKIENPGLELEYAG